MAVRGEAWCQTWVQGWPCLPTSEPPDPAGAPDTDRPDWMKQPLRQGVRKSKMRGKESHRSHEAGARGWATPHMHAALQRYTCALHHEPQTQPRKPDRDLMSPWALFHSHIVTQYWPSGCHTQVPKLGCCLWHQASSQLSGSTGCCPVNQPKMRSG